MRIDTLVGGVDTPISKTNPVPYSPSAVPAASVSHRAAVVAADVLAAPGTVTCTKLTAVGSATAGVYTVFVVARNDQGGSLAKQGDTTVTTETTNLGIRAAFAQVAGATGYDLYCSTDGAAAKFVGRVSEAQRASGIILTAVNTTGAGGVAGAVDIYVAGTGNAVNGGQLALNTAYVVPPTGGAAINCTGYTSAEIDLVPSRTGDSATFACTVIPFLLNGRTGKWYGLAPMVLSVGGAAGVPDSILQRKHVDVHGASGLVIVVASIAGTGASLDVDVTLS